MKKIKFLAAAASITLCTLAPGAQVKRTITKTDRFDFGVGGTVAITGAPQGSIKVIGGQKNEIEIVAKIDLQAATEKDISTLADITGFVTDEGVAKVSILSLGTHAKQLLKRSGKKIPKELATLPFRIDYTITVPRYCDLEIDGGFGELSVENVEGSLFVNFIETHASLTLTSGTGNVTVQRGSVDVAFGPRNWKGRSASIQVGQGDITAHFPSTLSANLDLVVLRSGAIENGIPDLVPRDRKVAFTARSIFAKAGVGGPPIKLGVGDGTIKVGVLGN